MVNHGWVADLGSAEVSEGDYVDDNSIKRPASLLEADHRANSRTTAVAVAEERPPSSNTGVKHMEQPIQTAQSRSFIALTLRYSHHSRGKHTHRKNINANDPFYGSLSKSKYSVAHTYCVHFRPITDML